MPQSTSPFGPRAEPLSVLVADDMIEIQELVRLWLGEMGCSVLSVSTGNDAAHVLRTRRIDVVITDILMPDGDGLEVIAFVKRIQSAARILAISGGGHHLRAADCLKFAKGLGAHGILLKPFSRRQLIEALGAILGVENPAPSL